jgi:hypothetical protein
MVDRVYPELLDFNEVVIWDGRLAHQALTHGFFCHSPERTVVALETPPGQNAIHVLIRLLGSPGSPYDRLTFDVKSQHEIDVPEEGVVVVNLELSFGTQRVANVGTDLPTPELHYHDVTLPARH